MNEDKRKEVLAHLEELRSGIEQRSRSVASDETEEKRHNERDDAPVLAHVTELRSLVERRHQDAPESAKGLEQRLLAWESEHPQLVALAARVARALEDVGL